MNQMQLPSEKVPASNTIMTSSVRSIGYVNPAQYERICQRRRERALREAVRPTLPRKKYLHESRHRHAVNRMRGQKGRFVNQSCNTSSNSNKQAVVAAQEGGNVDNETNMRPNLGCSQTETTPMQQVDLVEQRQNLALELSDLAEFNCDWEDELMGAYPELLLEVYSGGP